MKRSRVLIWFCSIVCFSSLVYILYVISYLTPDEIVERTPLRLRQDGWFIKNYREYIHEFEDFRAVIVNYWWFMIGHVLISFIIQYITNSLIRFKDVKFSSPNERFNSIIFPRIIFNIVTSLVFLYMLNGNNVIFMILIFLMNYYLSTSRRLFSFVKTRRRRIRLRKFMCYGFNMVLFLYVISPFTYHIGVWKWMRDSIIDQFGSKESKQTVSNLLPEWLFYSGIKEFRNWGGHFRLSFLRLISFGVDRINFEERELEEFLTEKKVHVKEVVENHEVEEIKSPLEEQISTSSSPSAAIQKDYGFFLFSYYVLYLPLFYSGPIISYNDFLKRVHDNQVNFKLNYRKMFVEIAKVVGSFLFLEIFSHFCFFNSVFWRERLWFQVYADDGRERFSTLEFYAIFYVSTMVFYWGKYYVIFGVSRIWSYLDHVEVMNDLPICSFMYLSGVQLVSTWHQSIFHWSMQYLVKEIYFNLVGNLTILVSFAILIHGLQWEVLIKYILFHVIPCLVEVGYEYLIKNDIVSVLLYSIFSIYVIPVHFTPFEISPRLILMKLLGLQWYGTVHYAFTTTILYILLLFVVHGSKYYLIRMFTTVDTFGILRSLEKEYFSGGIKSVKCDIDTMDSPRAEKKLKKSARIN